METGGQAELIKRGSLLPNRKENGQMFQGAGKGRWPPCASVLVLFTLWNIIKSYSVNTKGFCIKCTLFVKIEWAMAISRLLD